LAGYRVQIEELASAAADQTAIRRVEDLESIFAERKPTEYLIQPELAIQAVV
jgi:hypothetical protein